MKSPSKPRVSTSLQKWQEKISELKEKYETEKKEQENLALKKNTEIQQLRIQRQRYFIYGIGIVAVFLLFIFLQRIRTNRIRAEQNTMRLEQRLLRSQMNPHFIFNALISIQSYIYKKEPLEAGKYLSSFARLMRSILENSRDEYISLAKELQWLENYIELQKLRFENRFEYTVTIDDSIDKETTLIPPMLTQPFIENALEHGFREAGKKGELNLHFRTDKKLLYIVVKDNGVGFDQNNPEKKDKGHESLAVKITQDRVQLLNKGKSRKIHFHIDSQPDKGTEISFKIPLKKQS